MRLVAAGTGLVILSPQRQDVGAQPTVEAHSIHPVPAIARLERPPFGLNLEQLIPAVQSEKALCLKAQGIDVLAHIADLISQAFGFQEE